MNRHLVFILAPLLVLGATTGCRSKKPTDPPEAELQGKDDPNAERIIISVIGTNDLHGHIEALPVLGGYVNNLRAARENGGVILLDAGDMFQGTIESNVNEGAVIVDAYNTLGYTAAAIGNHEFDFGPVGPKAIPAGPRDDPRGALLARASEASFPFLSANILSTEAGGRPVWKNVSSSVSTTVAGVNVGLIGVTTIDTPRMTIADNFVGLAMTNLAAAVESEATALRAKGAAIVLVAAHAGGRCDNFHDPHDLGSCDDNEIFAVARQLPSGLVDAIVAGHTHQALAHRVNGIAIVEAYANGRAFSRVDLIVRDGVLKETVIFPPRNICSAARTLGTDKCAPGSYEGSPVLADPAIAAITDKAVAGAREAREKALGIRVAGKIRRSYQSESALGNLFADLMRAARPTVDVAITNGGGLRADLPEGTLTYGSLFQAMPFDNGFAFVTLSGAKLRELVENNMARSKGILLLSNVTATVSCNGSKPRARLSWADGRRIGEREEISVVTSDFLAAGGDGAFGRLDLPAGAIRFERGEVIREALVAELGKLEGPLRSGDYFDPEKPRLSMPGKRPLCKAER